MYTLGSPPMHIIITLVFVTQVIYIPFHLLIEADLGPIFRSSSSGVHCIMNVKS